jgi:predicted TIM-barrel fold metal-dependent hydrolase
MKGFKLHPEHQAFSPDNPRLAPVYEAAIANDLTILFHAGADVLHTTVTGTPIAFARMLDAWPDLRAVLAHMGGFRVWNDVARQLVGRDVFIDTAYSLGHLCDDEFVELVRAHGASCVLFGSDGPWTDARAEIEWLNRIGLTPRELDDILGGNAARLLGLGADTPTTP